MSRRVEVCAVDDLPPGERKIVEVDGLPNSIGVFNVHGEYYALANVCPHHLAPLCEGTVTGRMTSPGVGEYELTREGEVIQCPWHGWQFNIADGTSIFNPHELRTRTYETAVEPGDGEAADEPVEPDPEQVEEYGTALMGEEPPVDTYPVEVEREVVVVYV